MTPHYGIIESVLLLPITWYLLRAKTSASLITWVGGSIPGGFHRDDRHNCPYTKAQLLEREKAKNMDIEEKFYVEYETKISYDRFCDCCI